MQRGVLINLRILLFLVFLVALPFLIIFGSGPMSDALGCEMSGASMPDGVCGILYTLLMVVGWTSIGIVPLTVGALLLYLVGVIVFFVGNVLFARLRGQPVSPTAKGMGYSTLWILVLAGVVMGGVVSVRWYGTQYVSRCESLPTAVTGAQQNGPLALAVEVAAANEIEAYTVLVVSPEGDLLFAVDKSYRGRAPAWSPDGSQLAFATQDWQTKQSSLHLMDLQGNVGPALLTDQTRLDNVSWSPDGQQLLFEGISAELFGELFWLNADGSGRRQLTSSSGQDGDAQLSPDGRQIVFSSYRNGGRDIFLMDSDGSNVHRLTRHGADDINPAWSPDGRWIVFASNRGSNLTMRSVYNLYIMAADGSNQCQLTPNEQPGWEPVWSPDGQWIAYTAWMQNKVFLARPNGQELRTLPLQVDVKSVYEVDWAAQ